MSSATCTESDLKALRKSREYYDQLFGSILGWYNEYAHSFIYQILCLIGVFANICIIVVLLRAQMRKNPFNLFLIAIAMCDMTLMASYYIYKQVVICHPWFFEYWWIVFTYSYAVLSVFIHSASLWITVNMAVLRYLVLKNSASSNSSIPKLNTYSAATASIIAGVIISLIGSAPNMLRYEIRDNGMSLIPKTCLSNRSEYSYLYTPEDNVHAYTLNQPIFWSCSWERLSFWTAGLMLKLIPCLLLTIFMTLLVRMLMEARERRLRLCQRGSNAIPINITVALPKSQQSKQLQKSFPNMQTNNNQTNGFSVSKKQSCSAGPGSAERTTAMLTIIVAVFLITELPQGILVMTIGVQPQLGNLIDLLSLLNSSVNFILYSTMSNLFRNEFLQTFGQICCCFSVKNCTQHRLLKNPIFDAFNGRNRLLNRACSERHKAGSLSIDNDADKELLPSESKYCSNDANTTMSMQTAELSNNKIIIDNQNFFDLTVTSNGNRINTIIEKPFN